MVVLFGWTLVTLQTSWMSFGGEITFLVFSTCIEQIDIGGRDVTAYIQRLMRERKENVPSDIQLEVARIVKEKYTYTCPDRKKEEEKFDLNPAKYFKSYESIHKKSGKAWSCSVGYEQFLAPEMMHNPKIFAPSMNTPTLAELVDTAIKNCPIDTRKRLYENIVLSGGNTTFKAFGRRLQRDVKMLVESRLNTNRNEHNIHNASLDFKDFEVNVVENHAKTSSVWLGGSIVASHDEFSNFCYTKAQYEEEGARIFRKNIAFKAQL